MIPIAIQIDGMAEARELLAGLASEIQEKILSSALRKAADPIVGAAQWNAPIRTGALMKSIHATRPKVSDAHTIFTSIEPKDGWFTGEQFYGGYMEWGFTAVGRHGIRGGKRSRKRQLSEAAMVARWKPGQHFVTKAYDEKGGEAARIFYREIQEVAHKRAERYARRMARRERAAGI